MLVPRYPCRLKLIGLTTAVAGDGCQTLTKGRISCSLSFDRSIVWSMNDGDILVDVRMILQGHLDFVSDNFVHAPFPQLIKIFGAQREFKK
jgi:hypothetical protein